MTEANPAATKAKTAKHTASPFDLPNYEMPKFELPKMEVPESFRGIAKGATAYNLKVIEIARTNTNAAFDYANELMRVRSLSEFIELSTAQTRKQLETVTAQTKELTSLAQKVVTETAEPIKQSVTKAFSKVT